MFQFIRLSVFLLLFGVMAQLGAGQESGARYLLDVGDRVRITVYGHESLSGELTVDGNGSVVLPLVGPVTARGLDTRELSTAVAGRLQPDYLINPRISVVLLGYRPFYIIGEVVKPGSYPYVEGMMILNAVALASGFTPHANRQRFVVKRRVGTKEVSSRAKPEFRVQPGDVILVKERFF